MASDIKMYFDSCTWKKGVQYECDRRHRNAIRSIRFELAYLIKDIHSIGHTLMVKDHYNHVLGIIDGMHYADCISLYECEFYTNVAIMIWNCCNPTTRNRTYIEAKQKNTF